MEEIAHRTTQTGSAFGPSKLFHELYGFNFSKLRQSKPILSKAGETEATP